MSARGERSAAEVDKLAHLLGVEADRLAALLAVPGEDLQVLRRQIGDLLFQADRHHFAKVATLSKAVPPAVAAKIAEFALPPVLAARTAELLEPRRAVEMVARLSDGYLADVSAALDPGRASAVIREIPAARVATVAAELARRREWVVIGGFVSHVSGAALAASVREFDGAQLLRIGYVLDDRGRLDDITGLLSDAQLDDMLAAANEQDLWSELDELLGGLSAERAGRVAARFAAAEPGLAAATAAAVERGALGRASYAVLAGAPARA